MSSKVRIVIDSGHRLYFGGRARRFLMENYERMAAKQPETVERIPTDVPWWRKAVWLHKYLNLPLSKLMIFREPRRVRANRSRYMRLMRSRGMGGVIHRQRALFARDAFDRLDQILVRHRPPQPPARERRVIRHVPPQAQAQPQEVEGAAINGRQQWAWDPRRDGLI